MDAFGWLVAMEGLRGLYDGKEFDDGLIWPYRDLRLRLEQSGVSVSTSEIRGAIRELGLQPRYWSGRFGLRAEDLRAALGGAAYVDARQRGRQRRQNLAAEQQARAERERQERQEAMARSQEARRHRTLIPLD